MKIFRLYKFWWTLGAAVIMALLSVLVVTYSSKMALKAVSQSCLSQGRALLEEAESYADVSEISDMEKNLDPDDFSYTDACDNLFGVKSTYGCERIFIAVPKDDGYMYLADGSAKPDDEGFTKIGTEDSFDFYGKTISEVIKSGEAQASSVKKRGELEVAAVIDPIFSDEDVAAFLIVEFDVTEAVEAVKSQQKMLVLFCVIAGAVVCAVVFAFSFLFFKNVSKVSKALGRINGDGCNLTLRIPAKGGNELSDLASSCNNVMEQLQTIVTKVRAVSKQLAANSKMLCMRTDENHKLLLDTKVALEEIDKKAVYQNGLTDDFAEAFSSLKQTVTDLEGRISRQENSVTDSSYVVGDISDEIKQASEIIRTITDEYAVVVRETVSGKRKQELVTQQVATIVELSKNLEQMNTVISDISGKTNLLAMNAAIEAAHAGVAGKGFSVVASEIRALAESSSKQTDSIMTVIGDIQKAVVDIVKASNESSESFSQLGTKVKGLDTLFEKLSKNMGKQEEQAVSVKDSIKEMRESTQNINESYGVVKSGTKASAERLEKFRSSAAQILESEKNAGIKLTQIEQFTEKTTRQADQNVQLSVAVNNMLSAYKV